VIDYRILGPLEVGDQAGVRALGGTKERALLALLLLHANEPVSRERLIEELWSGEPPDSAVNALQVYVSHLRKALGADAIATAAGGYILRVDADALDAVRFERLFGEGRAALAGTDAASAYALLADALALWRGPALADFQFEAWAQTEVARLDDLRTSAIEERIEAELALGRHESLVAELEALVLEHPHRERLRGQLMLALYRSGRQAEALEVYREGRRVLDELGIEPGEELRKLELAILRQETELAPAAAPSSPLPTPPTPFVGRKHELDELAALLGREDVRLLTLTGTGGIGKTRLALEATRRAAAHHADGAAFVPLAAIGDEALVGPAIAKAVGLREDEPLAAALASRAQLLFLDSFEQLIGAAPLLGELLAAAPGLTMIVTSRATLRLAGEQEYPVQPLAEAPASTLFVQRAAAVSPEFALTDENAESIAAICSRLEGLPLAIELAAARTKLLTPAALLARLSSRLEVLTAGTRDAPERHQTMRAAIDWSYRLLDPAGQELFDELAVFVGGASLDAIEAVCGGDVFETLASLVDNSLVYRGHDAEPRFRMLDVIREYALEQLATRNETDVRARHAAYYLALAREAETELEGAHQQQWLDRLELEHPNLRAALDFALESGDELGALRGAIGLRRFWLLRGHLAQGRQRLEAVATLCVGDAAERAAVLNGLGFLAGEQGDFDASAVYFEQSLVLAREAGIPRRIAAPLANLGNLAVWRGDVERAIQLYGEALELHRAAKDEHRTALTLQNLGLAYSILGDRARAIELLDESLEIARRINHTRQIASTLCTIGRVYEQDGEQERARVAVEEALELDRELGDRQGIADCLEVIGAIDPDQERTAVLYGASAGLRDSIGARRHPEHVDWYLAVENAAREALGEEAFADAVARGRALELDDAVALAITTPNRWD
jgi:predicted ATPase/DNA-binding SARP family transcriptional activator/Tfp pilus assembly protein PilF